MTVSQIFDRPPCAFPEPIVGAIANAASSSASRTCTCRAFHDANCIAALALTGMIFVPCEKGISHSPDENASSEDLAADARMLAAALVELAGPAPA